MVLKERKSEGVKDSEGVKGCVLPVAPSLIKAFKSKQGGEQGSKQALSKVSKAA